MIPQVLMIDNDSTGVRIRGYVLTAAGYAVSTTTDPQEARQILQRRPSAIVTSLYFHDADGLPLFPQLRELAPGVPIIAITDTQYGDHADGRADRFVLKLDGPKALLQALREVLPMERHAHQGIESDRVVFVDRNRRFIDATEKACELIGYRHSDLLGKRIEDISVPPPREVKQQFAKYVVEGSQQGIYQLRHRDGHLVPIKFKATVLPDGCMAAEWEPLEPFERPNENS